MTSARSRTTTTRTARALAAGALAAVTAALGACAGGSAEPTGAGTTSTATASTATTSTGTTSTGTTSASTAASATTSPTTSPTEPAQPSQPVEPALKTLKPGAHGKAVKAMQQRLKDLGYWLPSVDGAYGGYTAYAVTALQKADGLSRDGVLGRKTLKALQRGVVPKPTSSKADVLEIDKKKQLLMVVHDGELRWIIDISSGSGRAYVDPKTHVTGTARTPSGSYRIQRQIDGWRTSTLGHLWRPKYFNGGIAFHGFPSVPAYAASHGCVRLPMAAMDMLWSSDLAPVGTAVLVRG